MSIPFTVRQRLTRPYLSGLATALRYGQSSRDTIPIRTTANQVLYPQITPCNKL